MLHRQTSALFRPDIQGLRAVAVLLVVVFHAGFQFLPGGYVGVDVFFVISGYLITGLLLKEHQRDGRIRLLEFYARRIRRLLPAANLVLLVTLVVAWLVYSPLEMKQFTSSAIATAFYLSNVWFAHISTDYLAEGPDANPLLHTWSLAAEEQFYMLWPLLLLFILHWAPATQLRRYLFIGMAAITVGSLALSIWLTEYIQPWAFFSSPSRAWEFSIGGLIALLPLNIRMPALLRQVLGWLGATLIGLSVAFLSKATLFPGLAAFLPVAGALMLLLAAHGGIHVGVSRLLSPRPMQFIGDISYSLYLWHWPVFVFMTLLLPEMALPQQIAGIALTFLLAIMTYYAVENPVRFYRPLLSKALLSIILGLSVSAAAAGLSMLAREQAKSGLTQADQQRYQQAAQDTPEIYRTNCHIKYTAVDPVPCWFGPDAAHHTVVLFGDSHAAHWLPAVRAYAEKQGWKVLSLTKTGCPAVSFEPFNGQLNRPYNECTEWREKAFELIATHRPKMTFISSYAWYFGAPNEISKAKQQTWQDATRTSLEKLASISEHVVLLRDMPRLEMDAPLCLSRAHWHGDDSEKLCQVSTIPAQDDRIFTAEQQHISKWNNVVALDLTDEVCTTGNCPVEQDGRILYYDKHHMTTKFSRSLANRLNSDLQTYLAGTSAIE